MVASIRQRMTPPRRRPRPARPKRRIPGLTGFAVLVLCAYNLGLPLNGGYLAIDMALVAIGFDLARSLHHPDEDKRWLKRFWLTHIAKIAAPLMVAVGLSALCWSWYDQLDEAKLRSVLGAVTMALNFLTIFGGADFTAIEHLWLIGVVAQFTIVVPVLVFGARTHLNSERRASAILGLAFGVALCRFGFLATEAAAGQSVAINTLTRVDGLLVGVAIGVAPLSSLSRWAPTTLAAPAFAALLAMLLLAPATSTDAVITQGLLTPVAVTFTGLVLSSLASGGHRGALSMTIDNHVMRWLGTRAISLYLWHYIFGFLLVSGLVGTSPGLREWPGFAVFVIRCIFSLAAAAISYRYLELPALAKADQIANRSTDEVDSAEPEYERKPLGSTATL